MFKGDLPVEVQVHFKLKLQVANTTSSTGIAWCYVLVKCLSFCVLRPDLRGQSSNRFKFNNLNLLVVLL